MILHVGNPKDHTKQTKNNLLELTGKYTVNLQDTISVAFSPLLCSSIFGILQ